MTIPKNGPGAHLLLVCVLGLCSSRVNAEEKNTAFHAVLSSADYASALDHARGRIEEAERLAATKIPVIGSLATEIIPNSTAAKLGLPPGTIIASFDGETVWGFFEWRERFADFEVVTFSSSGEETRYTIPSGMLGVHKGHYLRPELSLIRAHQGIGKPAWWDHAVLGALSYADNPALSVTAWSAAIREGYPEDLHSDLFAAIFAMQRTGELGPALDRFLSRFSKNEDIPLWCHGELATLLVSQGRIAELARIIAAHPGKNQWDPGDLDELAALKELADVDSVSLSGMDPLDYVESRPFRIINPEMVRNDELFAGRKVVVEGIFQLPIPYIARSPGKYFHNALRAEKPLQNIHVRLAARKLSVLGHHPNYEESMDVSLISQRAMRNGASSNYRGFPAREIILAGVSVAYIRAVPGQPRTPRFFFTASNSPGKWTAHTANHRIETKLRDGNPAYGFENLSFDLFRLGSEVFVYINRIPYVRMPISEAENDISVLFSCYGTVVEFDEFTIREYRP